MVTNANGTSVDTPQPRLVATLSLENERLFLAMVFLAIVPLWIGRYLPLVDLPQHAGQVVVLRELWAGDAGLADIFRVNWFTPYLLGYLLLYLFALVLPITTATQLLISLSVAAIPLLTGRLLRVAGADQRWKWLAIPCSFGFAFYWGFLSFFVAAPLCLLFLIQTIRFVNAPSVRTGILIALFAMALFFCHIIVLGFASLVALGYVWGASYRDPKALFLRSLPYAAPLPLIVLWMAVTYSTEARVQSDPISFGSLSYRLMQLAVQPAGRDDFSLSPTTVLIVTASVLWLPWLSGARFNKRPERWLPFVLGLLVFLASPHYVFNAAYFYQRLGMFLVPLWLMTWDAPQRQRSIDRIAIAVVVFWAATTIGRFAAFARESQSFVNVMAALEPGHRAAAMVYDNRSPLFALPVYLHFPLWYQATHRGVVDFNFGEFYSQMARYRPEVGPRITETVAWHPIAFRWDVNGGASYDYFIVKSGFDVSNEIFKDKRAAVALLTNSGWWWVYRKLEARDAAAPHAADAHQAGSIQDRAARLTP